MTLKEMVDAARSSNWFVAGSLLIAGGLGWASATTYLKNLIEEGIKTSAYLHDELGALNAKVAIPGPRGDQGLKGDAGPKGDPGPTIHIPAGAVVAFDVTVSPLGWSTYYSAAGRSIIGATSERQPGIYETYDYSEPLAVNAPSALNLYTDESKAKDGGRPRVTAKGDTYSFVPGTLENKSPFVGHLVLLYCQKLVD